MEKGVFLILSVADMLPQNDLALQPLEIIVARKGLFHDWLDSKGKLGGQHKVPRLSNTREYIEEMLKLNFKE